ncbi:class C beta-lactamase [Pantoea sp. KPR_PJ]|uniref:class C beta-lactamase n=1 Tax=Pantoea sp. KPR_PJ TaxID=2738375 RepID=UPI00352716BA
MKTNLAVWCVIAALPMTFSACAAQKLISDSEIKRIVDRNIHLLMEKETIPGMSVGVICNGTAHTFSYGQADLQSHLPVTENTLFELGSVSKTFTGLAGGYALVQGIADLNEPVRSYWPALPFIPWQQIRLLHLVTYTAGGLPLQLPDSVSDERALQTYYQTWQPEFAPGTVRAYSNASIGLAGKLMVERSGLTFEHYLTRYILRPLRLEHTFIRVPSAEEKNYAWGYRKGEPVRVSPGMLDAEAYGVKSTVKDMNRYLQANMQPAGLNNMPLLTQAIEKAQTRYFLTNGVYQGLGWEIYNWPVDPQTIINDSRNDVALKPHKTQALDPAQPPSSASWVHKTGSTNGFGAYIAFIPEKGVGIVMLANKSYPNPARVETAYRIISQLTRQQ